MVTKAKTLQKDFVWHRCSLVLVLALYIKLFYC
jgi:hypothetical protein